MPRMFAIVSLFCFAGWLVAAPVPKALKKSKTPELSGTTWAGNEDGFGAITYTFLTDGRFEYKHGNGEFTINGTWNQTGDEIYWEHNKKYSECRGKIEGGNLTGTKTNVKGLTWGVTLTLKKD